MFCKTQQNSVELYFCTDALENTGIDFRPTLKYGLLTYYNNHVH